MSLLFRRGIGIIVAAALTGAAALAGADDAPPPAATPDQATPDQAKPDQAKPDQAKPDQAKPEPAASPAPAPAAPAAGGTPLYTVVDGNHVDSHTMNGWRTWRAMACERCHGADQEGLVGPSLVADLKTMSREDFDKCLLEGRVDKGMPNFGGVKSVVDNLDNLYAFLKGRSDGAIPTGHLKEIQ